MRKRLSEQQKAQIIELHHSGGKPSEIAELVGCAVGTVYNTLQKNGLHHPREGGRGIRKKRRVCDKCLAQNLPEANFCMACGNRIKTKNEILAERAIVKLSAALPFVPAAMKDDLQKAVLELAEAVKNTAPVTGITKSGTKKI